jgi:hypothetical protein
VHGAFDKGANQPVRIGTALTDEPDQFRNKPDPVRFRCGCPLHLADQIFDG